MSDEPFNPEYYNHLLSSLTINSRTLITELTSIAEKNPEHSEAIVELIELRIKKCMPQYKLYSFYLLDSIVKNVGNPYNVLFNSNLYKIFTEAYLIVTDTLTRQNLINLFKTWVSGKTNSGMDIFNKDTIVRIEKFIIKATSISGTPGPLSPGSTPPLTTSTSTPSNIPTQQPHSTPQFALPGVIVPETFLRECNYLLQYVIQINKGIEQFEDTAFYRKNNRIRNDLIAEINILSDSLMRESKHEFEMKIKFYHESLVRIRTNLDNQNFKQSVFLAKKFTQNVKPNETLLKLLDRPLESYDDNDDLYFFLEGFGLPIKDEDQAYLPPIDSTETWPPRAPASEAAPAKAQLIAETNDKPVNPLGLGLGLDALNLDFREKRKPATDSSQAKPLKKVRFDV